MNSSPVTFKGIPANYSVIDKFVSRSAQPQQEDFIWLKEHGVTDIINFRTLYSQKVGFEEKNITEELGMKYHNIPTITKHPTTENVQKFLSLVENISKSNGKVHIHCFAGADRTGLYAFIYKMKMGIGNFIENKQEWIKKGHNPQIYPKLIPWAEKFVINFYPPKYSPFF